MNSIDSAIIQSTLTGKNGGYYFSISEGSYLIFIQAVGVQDYYSDPIIVNANKVIPIIELTSGQNQLKAVTVSAKRQLIEFKADRTIINVDASPTNTGLSALEILEKSPGISLDKDGNISLKGKQGVLILIDGRPSYLSGSELTTMLKSMPGTNLDQVEIMTNPPAKYDAAGNSGIINIKTKKSKITGLNVSLTAGGGVGRYPKTNESININYRNGRVNLFGLYSYNYNQSYNRLNLTRKFRNDTTDQIESVFIQHTDMDRTFQTHSYKVGADYFLNDKNTFGIVLNGATTPGNFKVKNSTNIFDGKQVLISETKAVSGTDERHSNFGVNLNFKHVFDTLGRELTIDADRITYQNSNSQVFTNMFYSPSGDKISDDEILRGNLPGHILINSIKADYTQPLSKDLKLEAGV